MVYIASYNEYLRIFHIFILVHTEYDIFFRKNKF